MLVEAEGPSLEKLKFSLYKYFSDSFITINPQLSHYRHYLHGHRSFETYIWWFNIWGQRLNGISQTVLFFLVVCSAPVGIQSDLPLDRISTSASTTPLENIRLFTTTPCWRADHTHAHNEYYIEVKLLELFKVTAIATQGASAEENCYVSSYYLMYVNERMKWVTYGGRKPKV